MASPAHWQAWAQSNLLRCGHSVLPDHQVLVWLASAAGVGLGAIVVAYGWPAVGRTRLQHSLPQAKELGRAGALQGKHQGFAHAG